MKFFQKWHKWVGSVALFFIIVFSLSGIFLNHRHAISGLDIPRSILPDNYRYKNWNNSAIKGSLVLSPDSIILYGGSGIWLTDSLHSKFTPFINGLRSGADNYNTINIIQTANNEIFALTTFDLYKLNLNQEHWINHSEIIGVHERLSDLSSRGDSLVVMTRSHLYISKFPHNSFQQLELQPPSGYKNKIPLFRAIWTLHSGEMFGTAGRLVVDFVALVMILLSLTGIVVILAPSLIRNTKIKERKISLAKILRSNLKWHNKAGAWFLAFFIIIALTGIFLRPPAMILIIRNQIKPLPYTMHDKQNAWFDKLRNLRYDKFTDEWLLYSSQGFYRFKELHSTPEPLKNTPQVSIMGITVLEQMELGLWVVGSFNGLYYWDRASNQSVDISQIRPLFVEGKQIDNPVVELQRGVVSGIDVTGYSNDFSSKEIVFSYSVGALTIGSPEKFAEMPIEIKKGRMSLWHFSLEAHVGRIYTFMVNSIMGESFFVLFSGVLIITLFISGYVVYRIKFRRKKNS